MNAIPMEPEERVRTMEEFNVWRGILTMIAFLAITLLTLVAAWISPWLGVASFILNIVTFLFMSFKYADASIVEKFLPLLWGRYVNGFVDGWVYLPLYTLLAPFKVIGYLSMNGQEFDNSFAPIERVPGDESEIQCDTHVYESINPQDPVRMLKLGGPETGRLEALRRTRQQFDQWIRDWLCSAKTGPQTVDQARGMGEEAINMILEKLFAWDIRAFDPDIPSEAVLGFVKGRQPTPLEQKLKEDFFDKRDPAVQRRILREGRARLEYIEKVRNGEISLALPGLGMVIRRIVIGDITAVGETAENLDAVQAANAQKRVRRVEAEGLADAAKILKGVPGMDSNPVEAVLVSEGVIKKDVRATEVRVSDALTGLGEILLKPLSDAFAARIAGGAGTKG